MAKKPKIETNEKGKSFGIVFFVLLGILIVLTVLLIVTKKDTKPKCSGKLGGEFTVKYETNGGNSLSNIVVCVACSPDSYTELSVPIREGYTFTGWYYDKTLTSLVDGNSTASINPEVKIVDGCISGYKDITLYAGWE